MTYGIPSATYKEGIQAQGFRDRGFGVNIAGTIGRMEERNIGLTHNQKRDHVLSLSYFFPIIPPFHYSGHLLYQ
jgi:hypothetical protein